MKRPVFIILLMLIATTPVWIWYAKRMSDGSDEPWGVLALVTLIGFVICENRKKRTTTYTPDLTFPALILLIYAISYPYVVPLLRAILAMTAVALTVSRLYFKRTCHIGLWGLAMLSLPLIASLQFYLGYPLRILVGNLVVPMLRMTGYSVVRDGAGLLFGENTILIDAPCSGIKMLWVGGYLVCILACVWHLSTIKTFIAGLIAITVIIAGNAIRTASLFYTETGLVNLPNWAHNTVGMIAFAMTAMVIVLFMQRLCVIRGQTA